MAESRASRCLSDDEHVSWLFCTPPPAEIRGCVDGVVGEEEIADAVCELPTSPARPSAVTQQSFPVRMSPHLDLDRS